MAKAGRKKGSIPWNKGLKGIYHIWPNGRPPISEETRKKIGLSGIGRTPWNKGKPYFEIRGDRNPNWKGGITGEDQTLRSRIEFKNWSKTVFKINDKKCAKCGSKKDLVAHHKKSFKKYVSLRYDSSNGIIVCRKCHIKIHHVCGHNKRRKYKDF